MRYQSKKDESLTSLTRAGLSAEDAAALRRISLTLRRWFEGECGSSTTRASWKIERDEATGTPYRATYPHHGDSYRRRIADREAGARRRLAAIMSRYPQYRAYVQTDPRGCALYLVPKNDLIDGYTIDQIYTLGMAVY